MAPPYAARYSEAVIHSKKAIQLFFLVLLVSCTKSSKVSHSESEFKVLVGTSSPSKDPLFNVNQDRLRVLALVYEPLLSYSMQEGKNEIAPLLLSELPTVSADQQTFKFKLKSGVKFSDTASIKDRTVTAKDAVMSLLRGVTDENSAGYGNLLLGLVRGLEQWSKSPSGNGEWFGRALPSGIKVVSDSEFSIQLTRKHPDFLSILTLPAFAILPVEVMGKGSLTAAVGTGPYMFVDSGLESKNWNLKPNPQNASAPRLKFKYVVINESDSAEDLKQSDFAGVPLKVATELVDTATDTLKNGEGGTLKKLPARRLELLVFNWKDAQIKKLGLLFRKAFMVAADTKSVIQAIYKGFGDPTQQFIPVNVEGGFDKSTIVLPNAEDAKISLKKLLGKKTIKIIFPETAGYWISELQKNLEKVGPYFEFEGVAPGNYLERVEKGEFQIAPLSWEGDLPEASNYLQLYYGSAQSGGQNLSGFKSASFDGLFDKLTKMFPSAAREKVAEQAHRIVLSELPAIPLGFKKDFVFLSSQAANFSAEFATAYALKDLLLKTQ